MSMYMPRHFAEHDPTLIRALIERDSFATLITQKEGGLEISHLPFLYEQTGDGPVRLVAHMARVNRQWRGLAGGGDALVVFNGPHAYVSPALYAPMPDNVPTWNYAVVHAHGKGCLIEDPAEAYAAMGRLVAAHDPGWKLALSDEDRDALLAQIAVFEIRVERFEAKLKLSQNRSPEDRRSVATSLLAGEREHERETGRLMAHLMRRAGSPD